jgi:hypothetical protein
MENAPCMRIAGSVFKTSIFLKAKTMLELFIELTNQIFWDGYAEQLAKEDPAGFQIELTEFINSYNN